MVLSRAISIADACRLDQPTSAGGYRLPARRNQGAAPDAWWQAPAIHRWSTSSPRIEGESPFPVHFEGNWSSRHPGHFVSLVPNVRRREVRQQRKTATGPSTETAIYPRLGGTPCQGKHQLGIHQTSRCHLHPGPRSRKRTGVPSRPWTSSK
jgi:hypothetical protein